MQTLFRVDTSQVNKVLRNLKDGFTDFRKPLKESSKLQMQSIKKQFDSEGSEITSPWKPLKGRTIAQRTALGFSAGPILQRTGKLKGSFRQKSISRNKLVIGTNNKYFPYHQQGGAKIPQRQILGHSQKMIDGVSKIFSDYLSNLIRNG